MSDVILPDWIEDLPPFAREHVEDLEAKILDLCRRLERARRRCRELRKLKARVKELNAERLASHRTGEEPHEHR